MNAPGPSSVVVKGPPPKKRQLPTASPLFHGPSCPGVDIAPREAYKVLSDQEARSKTIGILGDAFCVGAPFLGTNAHPLCTSVIGTATSRPETPRNNARATSNSAGYQGKSGPMLSLAILGTGRVYCAFLPKELAGVERLGLCSSFPPLRFDSAICGGVAFPAEDCFCRHRVKSRPSARIPGR